MRYEHLRAQDADIFEAISKESQRQQEHIELIASENFVSEAVLEAQGSVLTNKYAEGYPGRRYYGGCEHVDTVERLAIERVKELFGADHANVQPHSGAQANVAVFLALLNPGDKILGLDLDQGGHLTHGMKLNLSGKWFESHFYTVEKDSEVLDYDRVLERAREVQPKLIIAGASAYPRAIDFKRFREIADEVGALLMVDMAHIAGLVAAGLHENPVPYADVVTSTTHKTLRGPRGGIILCKQEYAKKIDSAVFPGNQGGPLMHVIAAKAVAFGEALQENFRTYQQRIVENTKALAESLKDRGYRLVADGTDTHLILVDLRGKGVNGKIMQERLDSVHITCNKNTVPYDTEKPFITSGIRLGTPAVTTRGMGVEDMAKIAEWIDLMVKDPDGSADKVRNEVLELCSKYPLKTSVI